MTNDISLICVHIYGLISCMSHMTFAIISVSTGFDLIETNGCGNKLP